MVLDAMLSSMKILLGLGFLTLLLPSVVSLKCFACNSVLNNNQCKQNQTCPEPEDRCLTIIDISEISRTISKYCATASTCTGIISTSGLNANSIGMLAECCKTDLCNVNGAGTIAIHKGLPALSLLVLLGLVVQ